MFNCLQALDLTPLCLRILSWKWDMTSALTSQRWGAGWVPYMVKEESTGKRGLWLLWVGTTWAQNVGRFRSCCDRCWHVCGGGVAECDIHSYGISSPGEGQGREVKAKQLHMETCGEGEAGGGDHTQGLPFGRLLSWGQCSHRVAWIFRVSPYASKLYSLQRVIR